MLRAACLLLALLVLGGCHRYAPLDGVAPAPGDEVRVRLTAGAAVEWSDRLGTTVRSVEGVALVPRGDSVALERSGGMRYAGTVFEARRDTLIFHPAQVVEVERRELSRGRTALAAAAVLAVGIWIIRAVGGSGSVIGDPGNGGGGPI
jgi:hypothetical protein